MSDYISRQAAIDAIITLWANKPFRNPALTEIKECVEQVPSADVRENVKGNLIEPYLEEYYGEWYHCSVCGSNMQSGNFCNECGADLRGE